MKRIFTILSFIVFHHTLAADGDTLGRQVKHKFITTEFGHTKWGLYRIPDQTRTKYPVIVFMHGVGEAGSTEADLSRLLTHGTPWLISQGTNLEAINPINGQLVKFISIALQNPTWSAEITDVMFALKNDPAFKERVDWRGVYVTGLSAGGQNCMNSLLTSQAITDSIRAIVPMSSAGANWTNISWARHKPVWAFHGLADQVAPYQNTQRFCDSIPGSRWTKLPNGHGPWNPYYSMSYRESISGISMNIYEWMLSKFPTGAVSIGSGTGTPVAPIAELLVNRKVIQLKSTRTVYYTIFSIHGQLLLSGTIRPGINNISMESFAAGLYLLKTELKTYRINLL